MTHFNGDFTKSREIGQEKKTSAFIKNNLPPVLPPAFTDTLKK